MLATGMPADCFEDTAGCSKPTVLNFTHKFAEWMETRYYEQVVKWPSNAQELGHFETPFKNIGLPGCIGSVDGVHVASDNIAAPLIGDHVGKEGYPTIVFNVTASHNRKIINAVGLFPGNGVAMNAVG